MFSGFEAERSRVMCRFEAKVELPFRSLLVCLYTPTLFRVCRYRGTLSLPSLGLVMLSDGGLKGPLQIYDERLGGRRPPSAPWLNVAEVNQLLRLVKGHDQSLKDFGRFSI